VRLDHHPALDARALLPFLAARAVPGVEEVVDGAYRRSLPDGSVLQLRPGEQAVEVDGDERAARAILRLDADPDAIVARLGDDPLLGPSVRAAPGRRIPGHPDPAELAVRALLGQQISVAAARTLAGRLAAHFGDPLPKPAFSLTHLFPSPRKIARASSDEISALGITTKRAQTLIALASAISRGDLALSPGSRIEETLTQLQTIPGIGQWTAQYIAMRALAWPDAFPHTDLGICKALDQTNPNKILELAEKWRPWRAYAALHFWTNLEKKT